VINPPGKLKRQRPLENVRWIFVSTLIFLLLQPLPAFSKPPIKEFVDPHPYEVVAPARETIGAMLRR